ncbi:hypothetical protein ETB97_001282 [Aspergillus alliaceus]|uniref:DUF6536 domain-containing protein n=1 Tax=Petromyces alliaceus TaxID=209559 RepID=A0A8H6A442_PETAA|nr:hypothetical protein ETB97_001282 [Aspergillus burnettii]
MRSKILNNPPYANSARADSDDDAASPSKEEKNRPRTGYEWRNGAFICFAVTIAILLLNLVLTVIAASRARGSSHSFLGESIFEGDCAKVKHWSTGFHLLINVLGTILLGASSYCMQCLSAPSRDDVNQLHACGKWVDIGTPSVTNLRFMRSAQIVWWCLLLLSSVPFHVFYNSAIFSALSSNSYGVAVVSSNVSIEPTSAAAAYCYDGLMGTDVAQVQAMYEGNKLEVLDKEDCVKAYAVPFLSNRRTVLLVTNNGTIRSPGMWAGAGNAPASLEENQSRFNWMCNGPNAQLFGDVGSGQCFRPALLEHVDIWAVYAQPFVGDDIVVMALDGSFAFTRQNYSSLAYSPLPPSLRSDIDILGVSLRGMQGYSTVDLTWDLLRNGKWETPSLASMVTVYESNSTCPGDAGMLLSQQYYSIDYCLSEKVEEHCRLMYSPLICVIIIACNATKAVCMLFTLRLRREDLLFTIGDAIASFLKHPDTTTLGRSFMDRRSAKRYFSKPTAVKSEPLPSRRRWFYAASGRRWAVCMTCYTVSLFAAAEITYVSYQGVTDYLPDSRISTMWSLGFNTVRPEAMLRYLNTYNTLAMVLLANTPQIVLSTLYYLTNSLLTSMVMAAEYNSYSVRRKHLRVTWPEGDQRSTYFLSLPYSFSIPTIVVSAVLHWLLSMSISYVAIYQYDMRGAVDESKTISTCVLSPIAMIFTLSLAGLVLITLMGLAFRRFPTNMPVAGSCSLAISAACHPPLDDEDAGLKPVMWGESVISRTPDDGQGARITGEQSAADSRSRDEAGGDDGTESEETSFFIHHCSFMAGEVEEPHPSRLYA